MNQFPYSIYTDKRHIKIAFLLNKKNRKIKNIFDMIFDYSVRNWGGRFNPIILVNNRKIEEKEWEFLYNYDPDFIKTFTDLNKKTVEKIDNFLSPIYVKKGGNNIDINVDPVSIMLTFKNLKKISLSFEGDFKLAIFDFTRKTPVYIKKFIKYNFGLVDKNLYILKNLDERNKKVYKIKNLNDLGSFLDEAGEYRSDIVFPIQLPSLNSTVKEPEYNYDYEKFEVIIGDSIDNLIYHWNRSFHLSYWLRPKITSIWLPERIAQDKEISGKLSKFINRYANLTGNDNNRGVRFVNFDLRSNTIKSIKNKLSSSIHLPCYNIKLKDFQTPVYIDFPHYFFNTAKMDYYRGRSDKEIIALNEPDIEQESMAGRHWIADVRIQFRPERFSHIIGGDYWWQLPNRNILAHQMIRNKPSRITKKGFLSVLMKGGSSFLESQNEKLLEINMLDDKEVIRFLCYQRFSPCFNGDYREIKKISQYTNLGVNISNNGKNLNGLISLFDGLNNTHNVFSKRYWRRIFDEFSKKEKILNSQQEQTIGNMLSKRRDVRKVVEYLFDSLRGTLNNERFFKYGYFQKEAKKEIEDYNNISRNNNFKFKKYNLEGAIQYLLEQKILIMGIFPRCPVCGTKNWYSVEKIEKNLKCEGCSNSFSLKTEEAWHYALNSLVKNCHVFQGLAPIVMVLGELLNRCNSCFLYSASLDVYKGRNKNPLTDLDIVCVRDGKFIIGEIKQSLRGFKNKDFEVIKNIARKIKPDIILFSSLETKPNRNILSKIKELKKDLEELGIDVVWHEISSYDLEPSPYFM